MSDERYHLVYEAACQARDAQERSVDELRSRVGTTLSSVVVATAFFGTVAIRQDHLGAWQWEAIALFVVTAAGQAVLLIPLKGWRFRSSPQKMIAEHIERADPDELDDMYRDLALHIGQDLRGNEGRLRWMWWVFVASLVTLVTEVAVWLVAMSH